MNNNRKYPHFPGEVEQLKKLCLDQLEIEYSGSVPENVKIRLAKELDTISFFEMCGVFLILRKLIQKSGLRKYELGSYGRTGASLVAHLCGLTPVNPMEPRIALYPQVLFGIHYDREPDIGLCVPKGKADCLYTLLKNMDGVANVVCPLQEDGTPLSQFRLLLPENAAVEPLDFYLSTTPFYRVVIEEDENLFLLSRMVELTGIFPDKISLSDQSILEMYRHTDTSEMIDISPWHLTSIGLPGIRIFYTADLYGAVYVKLNHFEDLVRLDCLTHCNGAWEKNQEEMVCEDGFPFSKVMTCREDVLEFCRDTLHLEEEISFRIMEHVGNGNGFPHEWFDPEDPEDPESETESWSESHLPSWFHVFCSNVNYLPDRVSSYFTMLHSWQCAWYRLYYPTAFYMAYFEIIADEKILSAVFSGRDGYDAFLRENAQRRSMHTESPVGIVYSDTEAESFAMDLAIADEMYFRGIDLTSPYLLETCCSADFLMQEIKTSLKRNTIAAFREEWSQGNLKIQDCELFQGQPEIQEQLVLLIKQAWEKGHRFTLHFKKYVHGCDILLDGLADMKNAGNVIIDHKLKVLLYGLSIEEMELVEHYYGDFADVMCELSLCPFPSEPDADVVIIKKERESGDNLESAHTPPQYGGISDVEFLFLTGTEIRNMFQKGKKGKNDSTDSKEH